MLDGYQWKLRENAEFTFTAKDIMIALGYSSSINSEVCKQIYCLLDALVKLGFVRYRDEWQHEPNSKISATKRLVLEFVARNMAEVGIDFVENLYCFSIELYYIKRKCSVFLIIYIIIYIIYIVNNNYIILYIIYMYYKWRMKD